MKYSLIIHGGCGQVEKFTKKEQEVYAASLEKIITSGEAVLSQGGTAQDAVEHCVRLLEDDPLYNAGKGSVLNAEGVVEMDASIMDGKSLKAGAIAGVKKIKNPISVARKVMEKTEHIFLIGSGAEKFARSMKAEVKPPDYFITTKRRKQLKDAQAKQYIGLDHGGEKSKKTGTVGAVARDSFGNIAAATSTGGLVNKRYGRVGDSALIGCGTYADNNTCGVSCTGIGEDFIRTTLAKHTSNLILMKGLSAKKAAQEAIKYFKNTINGYGGLILIDKKGEIGEAYSTSGMLRAWVKQGSKPIVKLFQ